MPQLTIQDRGTFEVESGTRLVNAISAEGVDIGHRCGGFARCTTCRVKFVAGEPTRITVAERDKLAAAELSAGERLACQIVVDADMTVIPLMLASEQGWPDQGSAPEPEITPPAEWVDR